MSRPDLVLFDLDGTLIDSAPDLAGAANDLRAQHGLEALPFERLRHLVGAGARGMVGAAFGVGPGDDTYDALRQVFLQLYEARMLRLTRVFDGVWPVLQSLERAQIPWGVVTNKAYRLAHPLALGLELLPRAAVLIGGDTTAHAKPHPLPLLEAARRVGCDPQRCAYVGDDIRDMRAGLAAGMFTVAARWGYLGEDPIETWGAHRVIDGPDQLLNAIELA